MNIPICPIPSEHPVNIHRLVVQYMASRTTATEPEVVKHVMRELHGKVNPLTVLAVVREITSPSMEILQ